MARKKDTVSVLVIGANGLAWARFERRGRIRVCVAQETRLLSEESPEATRQILADLDARENLKRDGNVILVLPRHEVTTRVLTLPSQHAAEIDAMLHLSAEEYVPYPAEEVIIDHVVLDRLPNGESRVFAALAHRDVVERAVTLCESLGIHPERVVLSTTCLTRLKPVDGGDAVGVVLLLPGGLEVAVFRGGALVYSRGVSNAVDWTAVCRDPEQPVSGSGIIQDVAADDLAAEVRSSLSMYRRESADDEAGVRRVLVGADGCDTGALCRALATRLNLDCAPFEAGGAVPGIAVSGAPGASAPAWCAVGALVEDDAATEVDLTPERLRVAARGRRLSDLFTRVGVMLAAAVVLLFVAYRVEVSRRVAYIVELEQQVQALEPRAKGIAEMREQLNILRRQVDRSGSILEQLAAVVSAVPQDRVNITRVSLSRNDGITVWGRAKTVDDVAEYAQNLRAKGEQAPALAFFAAARSLYEQKAMEQNQEIFTYQIDIPRTPPEEEGRDANRSQ
ncbi:MAG: pilus assembly protein PilM [Candidatus Hydrogenedentes bacterium]|nr:pilus assembly protein PilM [Candidatus Hydrogenedentota bacterium]